MNCNPRFFLFVFFKFSSKVYSPLLNSFTFHFFTKRCLANKRSSPRTYIGGGGGGGGGVNLRSVSSQAADKMVILGSFPPRNYLTFYRNNIVFGIKLQLRSSSIKWYYSFRPTASYRDARGEDTNAHTHAHLFLLK